MPILPDHTREEDVVDQDQPVLNPLPENRKGLPLAVSQERRDVKIVGVDNSAEIMF